MEVLRGVVEIDDLHLAEIRCEFLQVIHPIPRRISLTQKCRDDEQLLDELLTLGDEVGLVKLDMEVRAAAEADGKKITEKVVENTVKVSEAYQNANAHCRKLKAHRDTKRNDEKAFGSMRSSSLTQMSANRRSELESLAFSEMKAA